METILNLPSSAAPATAATSVIPRAMTTKVQPTEEAAKDATLPSNKPFVAQVVTARLSGAEYPENPTEIVPAERTLRPYDVPMLPYDGDAAATQQADPTNAETEQLNLDDNLPNTA